MLKKAYTFYKFLLILIVAGYSWLTFNLVSTNTGSHFTVCPFKTVTTIPCPSCGSTRSIEFALHGDIQNALLTNPLGLVTLVIMIVMPVWIISDFIRARYSFYTFYKASEQKISKGIWTISLIVLILANWIWNIVKDV